METPHTIYIDHAATTPVDARVLEAMMPYFITKFGNASSVHALGQKAKQAIDEAREQVARAIGASASEIYFTSGGTEADNWAIYGAAMAHSKKGKHLITSQIEHHAVLHRMQALEKQGYEVTYLPVDELGLVCASDLEAALREDTILVSIMMANNEVGTIQPIAQLGAICRARGVLFHTDAVQAVGHIPVDVKDLSVDMLALSAHKFFGPQGVGALYIRRGVRIDRLFEGGAHERGRRAGTENLPAIVGMGVALTLAVEEMEQNAKTISALRDSLWEGLQIIPHIKRNGHPTAALPGHLNVSVKYIEGEGMLLLLDMEGIAASSGSACTSGSLDPSHVLLAMGLDHGTAHGSLRMTLSQQNTQDEINHIIQTLPRIVTRLREMSPLWAQEKGEELYV